MAESYENQFNAELFKKYEICKKILIPKEVYFTMIENIEAAAGAGGQRTDMDTTYYQSLRYCSVVMLRNSSKSVPPKIRIPYIMSVLKTRTMWSSELTRPQAMVDVIEWPKRSTKSMPTSLARLLKFSSPTARNARNARRNASAQRPRVWSYVPF
ncbi:hypothetical protein SNE40_013766 [Patella caerulea]|uniref:Uncharacterized protein n=1 Tax=Patella caerulea TaxID=87958 RepID=A0AAN8JFP4_PATCE